MYTDSNSTAQRYGPGSNYGYACGGWDSYNRLSTIDRFQFPFDNGTTNQVGNLRESRFASSANNSSTYGYIYMWW